MASCPIERSVQGGALQGPVLVATLANICIADLAGRLQMILPWEGLPGLWKVGSGIEMTWRRGLK